MLPNNLITDIRLSYSARRLGAVLYSRRNALGSCRKSLKELAAISTLCKDTVRKAVAELTDVGYISVERRYVYSDEYKGYINDKSVYHCSLDFTGGYTLVPRSIFDCDIQSSAFVIYLYLYYQAGNRKRAFPSIRDMVKHIGIACSTVCRALKILKTISQLLIWHCKGRDNKFRKNTYRFVQVVRNPFPGSHYTPKKEELKEPIAPISAPKNSTYTLRLS